MKIIGCDHFQVFSIFILSCSTIDESVDYWLDLCESVNRNSVLFQVKRPWLMPRFIIYWLCPQTGLLTSQPISVPTKWVRQRHCYHRVYIPIEEDRQKVNK